MPQLPPGDVTVVLRTEFTDEGGWESVCAALEAASPDGAFQDGVRFVSDPAFDGAAGAVLVALTRDSDEHPYLYAVDRVTLSSFDLPVLVVDESGRSFRVVPAQFWTVEANLARAAVDFEEFADAADDDGVFRGF
ncbi:hypothetical protein Val02_34850 [Virgisporangium aliadipatigenens]|uniref:DUF6924 domain-containing protein n=1 Tax=Virgisporangium aliadipatigenens TaxID=741659 RepID=A0A8J4DQG8_9ACTN|nr:hypothetical protein [Virgisporangium aliadipatigenens]GIJ46599.1 hypothetical protein Val02_34850 [Virgisporangium aliadipatigenens]